MRDGEEECLDAWIQYQAKMKRSSDTKYDVKFKEEETHANLTSKETKTQGSVKAKGGTIVCMCTATPCQLAAQETRKV